MSALALEGLLSALEQQVAALRAQQGGGEALQANYLTVSPSGQVGAKFSGLIEALGLVLPSGAGVVPASQSQVQWQRQSDGAVVAAIYGTETTSPNHAELYLQAEDPTGDNEALVNVVALGGGETAQLVASASAGGAEISATAGSGAVEVIGDGGISSFLQLLSAQELQMASGSAQLTWAGGFGYASNVTFTHSLGRVPQFGLLAAVSSDQHGYFVAPNLIGSSFTTTQGELNGYAPQGNPPAGETATVYWAVFG